MKKKQAKMTLRKKLSLIALAVLTAVGLSLGAKHYREGLPKYQVGECLFDSAEQVYVKITGVKDGKYQFLAQILIFVMPGEMEIRKLNAIDTIVKINCETGEPLEPSK